MSTLDFSHLSTQERLVLIEELWDSIDRDKLPLTEAQAIEVDRRLAQLDRLPGEGGMASKPWLTFGNASVEAHAASSVGSRRRSDAGNDVYVKAKIDRVIETL